MSTFNCCNVSFRDLYYFLPSYLVQIDYWNAGYTRTSPETKNNNLCTVRTVPSLLGNFFKD